MTPASPAVLLYDWDNTLVDGWAGITAALNAVFGIADARRHLIAVDPQAQLALQQFGEAQKLTDASRGATKAGH